MRVLPASGAALVGPVAFRPLAAYLNLCHCRPDITSLTPFHSSLPGRRRCTVHSSIISSGNGLECGDAAWRGAEPVARQLQPHQQRDFKDVRRGTVGHPVRALLRFVGAVHNQPSAASCNQDAVESWHRGAFPQRRLRLLLQLQLQSLTGDSGTLSSFTDHRRVSYLPFFPSSFNV